MDEETAIIEEELVYGALRRERLWQRLGLLGLIFGILGCLSAAAVVLIDPKAPNAALLTRFDDRLYRSLGIVETLEWREQTGRSLRLARTVVSRQARILKWAT